MFWLSQHHRANSGYSNTKIFDINSFDNCFTDLVASSTECTALKESSMKKILLTVPTAKSSNSFELSSAVWSSAKFTQIGDDLVPKRFMQHTFGLRDTSPFGNQRNPRKSLIGNRCENLVKRIESISQVNSPFPTRNRNKTLTRLFIKSGPESSSSSSDRPRNFAAQLKTTRNSFGFCGWNTTRWGRINWTSLWIDSPYGHGLCLCIRQVLLFSANETLHSSRIFFLIDQDGPTLASNCYWRLEHPGSTALPLHNGYFWLFWLLHNG